MHSLHYLGHLRILRVEPMERLRIFNMATIGTLRGGALVSHAVNLPTARGADAAAQSWRPRKITPEAGRAIEMLGHAIEYLADEFAVECRNRTDSATVGKHPQVAAIELLMARNREIYYSCPVIPSWKARLFSLFATHRA